MAETKSALQKALAEQQELNRVLKYIEDLDQQLHKARTTLSKLTKEQIKEFEDLQVIEQTSLKSLFYKILGSKEQQIEKERQEYLKVALKYDEAKKTVDLLEYERSVLEKKLTDAEKLEQKIASLKKQREAELMQGNSLLGQRLLQIAKEEDELLIINREIGEAIAVGSQANQMLHQIISLLRQSGNWGHWGRSGRGGIDIGRYNRHSSIDRAKNLAYQVQQYLRQFELELSDVYRQQKFNLNFEIGSFNSFVHILFNNLLSDWIIQQKVQNAVSGIVSVRDRVTILLGNLETDRRTAADEIERLKYEREQLVMKG